MSEISNIPSRTLKRLVYETPVGTDLYILYKGTLLFRQWAKLYGVAAAREMHSNWVSLWNTVPSVDNDHYVQLDLL